MTDPFGVVKPKATYYEYYTYVIFGLDYARRGHRLTQAEVVHIDTYVAEYNGTIRKLVKKYNKASRDAGSSVRYVIVDIADHLLQLAFKRNNGRPTYEMPPEALATAERMRRPIPNTLYYHTDRRGHMLQGGVFSLDGVHPSAIGQGLLAVEFIKKLEESGVTVPASLGWDAIFASDSLYSRPISLMPELYENTKVAELILDLLNLA
ncbi:hypothetical protein [Rhodospirillaceae bacterium SYSU D60014]|uniref:hypothetical protein n=1 Tax=Virgifigura deserti TaxID=2268457 RepID=UPI0013C3FA75